MEWVLTIADIKRIGKMNETDARYYALCRCSGGPMLQAYRMARRYGERLKAFVILGGGNLGYEIVDDEGE